MLERKDCCPDGGHGVERYGRCGRLEDLHADRWDQQEDQRLGVSLSAAGDVNGDGIGDILVGSRYNDIDDMVDVGSAYLYSGSDGQLVRRRDGEHAGDRFGVAVKGIGDVDQDGLSDQLVGAQFATDNGPTGAGAAYVFSGSDGRLIRKHLGSKDKGLFGVAVGGGQDLNDDGIPDYLVGAFGEGAVDVYSAADGQQLAKYQGAAGTWYGSSVALIPDIDGDGVAEIIMDSPGDGAGSAQVLSGKTGSVLYSYSGDTAGDWYGFAVAAAGDVDNDGTGDLLVGAREAVHNGLPKSGSAYLHSGKTGALIRRLDGEAKYDRFSTALDGIGDLNRDGWSDFAVGARFATNSAGESTGVVYVYSGKDLTLLAKQSGEAKDSWFGASLAGLNDLDPDGYSEVIVGAAEATVNDVYRGGRVYVLGMEHYDVSLSPLNLPKTARAGDTVNADSTVLRCQRRPKSDPI
jgi:hypothetical protein